MALQPGAPTLSGDVSESRPAADGVEAGDAVMINEDGEMAAVDSEGGDLAGVSRHTGDNEGRGNALGLAGAHVVAAADDVSAGDRVNAGNATDGTTGVVATDADGPALALSDTGGSWYSEEETYDVPDGYAVVFL